MDNEIGEDRRLRDRFVDCGRGGGSGVSKKQQLVTFGKKIESKKRKQQTFVEEEKYERIVNKI